jgi:hypothetical protein
MRSRATRARISGDHDVLRPSPLADAHLGGGADALIRPFATSRPTYWVYHELWRILAAWRTPRIGLERRRCRKDAVFDHPLPFLMPITGTSRCAAARDKEGRGWIASISISASSSNLGLKRVSGDRPPSVGSPTSDFYRELSELYARGCVDAVRDDQRYRSLAHPIRRCWRSLPSLSARAIEDALP